MVFEYIFLVFMLGGLWVFCSAREHLLSTLLSLEFMVLGIFFFLLMSLGVGSLYYSLMYLIITACEGALGLSVLILMGRTHGGDYLKFFSIMI